MVPVLSTPLEAHAAMEPAGERRDDAAQELPAGGHTGGRNGARR